MAHSNETSTKRSLVKGLIRFSPVIILFMIATVAYTQGAFTSMGVAPPGSKKKAAIEKPAKPDPQAIYDSIFKATKAAKFDSLVHQANESWGFHGVILVAKDGKLIYEGAVGNANFKDKRAVTTDDIFQLASVSKQFTAMSIMMLAEQGLISYDDTITKYFPELPYSKVTIRQCLNHTAGFPNYMWLVEHKWEQERAPSNEEVIALMAKHELPLYFTPGRRFDYSNTGYMVLATLVERVSGKSFPEFVAHNIFEPLGMKHSYVYSAATDDSMPGTVYGYIKQWRKYRIAGEDPNNGCVGDKGVFSTADDLLLWDDALNNYTLVSDSSIALAFTHGKTRRNHSIDYGFGFRLKEKDGIKYAYHHGLWNGFRTAFVKDLTNGYTYILLNHTSTSAKNRLLDRLEMIALEEEPEIQVQVTAALQVLNTSKVKPNL